MRIHDFIRFDGIIVLVFTISLKTPTATITPVPTVTPTPTEVNILAFTNVQYPLWGPIVGVGLIIVVIALILLNRIRRGYSAD